MTFVQTYIKEILTVVVPLVMLAISQMIAPRTRLMQGVRHSWNMLIEQPQFNDKGEAIGKQSLVRAASVQFVNTGKSPATDVEVTFNWRPQHLNVWPSRHYTEAQTSDGRFTLKVGTIPPKAMIGIEIMAVNGELPAIASAHCKECTAKSIELAPSEVHPRWKLLAVGWFIVVGFCATVYLGLALLQLIAGRY